MEHTETSQGSGLSRFRWKKGPKLNPNPRKDRQYFGVNKDGKTVTEPGAKDYGGASGGPSHSEKKLAARIKDWDTTINDGYNRAPCNGIDRRIAGGGYHKPGSNKK